MTNSILATLGALAVGSLGGALFFHIGTPLPWLLGAFAATLIVTVTAGRIDLDVRLRRLVLPVMGVLIGSSFHPEILEQVARWPGGLISVAAFSALCTTLGYLYFTRVAGWDGPTALYSAPPGGLAEMVFVGSAFGADERRLVLSHTMRIAIVVVSATLAMRFYFGVDATTLAVRSSGPIASDAADWLVLGACALVGGFLGIRLKLPGGAIFGALLLSAAVHLSGLSQVSPPSWVVAAAQVVLGSSLGVRFRGTTRREVTEIVSHAFVWGFVLLLLAFGSALVLGPVFSIDPRGLFLALSPGGFVEMLLVALAIGIESAFVATCHALRLIFIFFCVPVVGRIMFGRRGG